MVPRIRRLPVEREVEHANKPTNNTKVIQPERQQTTTTIYRPYQIVVRLGARYNLNDWSVHT